MAYGLFQTEENLAEEGRAALQAGGLEVGRANFERLLEGYEKLLKETKRIVRISDRNEEELNRLGKELAVKNDEIERERKRADDLLHAILPARVVEELKLGGRVLPRSHGQVAVLFCDIVGFTPYSESHDPENVLMNLGWLNEVYERLTERFELEKINSVGDEFLAATGLVEDGPANVLNCVRCGFEMISAASEVPANWQVRVGIHVGPVISGVVGTRKFLYGIWGDTVNTAARMQSHGIVNGINLSKAAWELIQDSCMWEYRGMAEVKGKGNMEMYQITGFM